MIELQLHFALITRQNNRILESYLWVINRQTQSKAI
jgi:hypothetical protein